MRRILPTSVGVLAALAFVACAPAVAPEPELPATPVLEELVEEVPEPDPVPEPVSVEESEDEEVEELPDVVEAVPVEPREGPGAECEAGRGQGCEEVPLRVSGEPGRFIVLTGSFGSPDTTMDVPLNSMPVIDGVVNPPNFTDAFLVEGYGSPRTAGTTYIALHSARGLPDAAGNALIDTDTQTPTVELWDRLIVDNHVYHVTEVRMVGKEEVVHESDIWEQVDGRLVVFTCMQLDQGPSVDNVVIIAEAATIAKAATGHTSALAPAA